MIDFETHSCDACGEQFIVVCEKQLQEKLKKHKSSCHGKRSNKKRERSQQLRKDRIALFVHDIAVDRLNQHNFDKLVSQGMIVNA